METRAAFDLLRSLKCDLAQGYFIARPMEASAVLSWASEWKHPDDDHELFRKTVGAPLVGALRGDAGKRPPEVA